MGVRNRFGGGETRYAATRGLTPRYRRSLPETGCVSQGLPHGKLTPSFRRSLPETGCLSQGLPHGKRYAWPCPPKAVKHPQTGRRTQRRDAEIAERSAEKTTDELNESGRRHTSMGALRGRRARGGSRFGIGASVIRSGGLRWG